MAASRRLEFPSPAAILIQTIPQSIIYKTEGSSEFLKVTKRSFVRKMFNASEFAGAVPYRLDGFPNTAGHLQS